MTTPPPGINYQESDATGPGYGYYYTPEYGGAYPYDDAIYADYYLEDGHHEATNHYCQCVPPGLYARRYIHINVDCGGNITVYPRNTDYDAMFGGGYLFITLPLTIDVGDISTALPYGWTYTISHGIKEVDIFCEQSGWEDFLGTEPKPYTLIRIRHTWNNTANIVAAGGYIGFQPLVSGWPGSYTLFPNVNTLAALETAITGPGVNNRVIAITGPINLTGAIQIPAGRSIIIASQGTNLTTHVPGPTIFTITRTNTNTGRHFIVAGGASLTLSAITLDGNAVDAQGNALTRRGGVQVLANGRLTLQNNATITRTHGPQNQGSAVHIAGVAQPTAPNGNTVLNIHPGARIYNNRTTVGWGGAVQTTQDVTVNMYGGIIEHNHTHREVTSGNGHSAGIHLGANEDNGGRLIMHGGEIRYNVAHATHLGGVFPPGGGRFRAGGAGVFVHRECTFTMYGGSIHGNLLTASRPPGTSGGEFLLHGAGVLMLADTTTFNMLGGSIHNNHVLATAAGVDGLLAGGGVGMFGGAFTMDNDAEIHGNSAVYGGGVYVSTSGNLTGGGSVFVMNDGSIHSNRADRGAGVGVSSTQPTLIQYGPTTFTMNGGTISNNRNRFGPVESPPTTPPLEGGGVWVLGMTTPNRQATFNFRGGTIGDEDDVADGNRALRGGGLWIGNGAAFNMALGAGGSFGRVMHNQATGTGDDESHGGGIYARDAITNINLGVGIVQGNTARNGGGVAITNNAIFHLYGTAQLTGNIALANAGQTANGGGVFASTGSTFNLAAGPTFSNNIARAIGTGAEANGGALAIHGNIFNMATGAVITGNRAEASNGGVANGGGLALLSGNFTLQAGRTIVNNTAAATAGGTTNGGGIAVQGGTFTTQVNISGNHTRQQVSMQQPTAEVLPYKAVCLCRRLISPATAPQQPVRVPLPTAAAQWWAAARLHSMPTGKSATIRLPQSARAQRLTAAVL